MDNLKFRAWCQKNNEMYYADEIYCFKVYNGSIGYYPHYYSDDLEHYNTNPSSEEEQILVMQFIGKKDKNGKEIFESDIVHIPLYGNTIIVWNDSICAFQCAYKAVGKGTSIGGRMTQTIYARESDVDYEVIGNIYENPNLL